MTKAMRRTPRNGPPALVVTGPQPSSQASTRPGLTYRGIDLCDRCGSPLRPSEAMAGLCRRCVHFLGQVQKELR